ncbi:MAG: class I SAM-dependent methyltransferase [Flavobacteriales bacterium]
MSKAWDKVEKEARTEDDLLPNRWLKACLDELEPGKIFIPGAGEGHSAVYAALHGWEVHAYDRSSHQQRKALARAEERGADIEYWVGDMEAIQVGEEAYDAIAPLFVHLPPIPRKKLHARLMKGLKGGGHWIMEAFSKEQISYYSGGPPDIDRLFAIEDIESDLNALDILNSTEEEIELKEGGRSMGPAKVIRLFGKKA